MIYASAQLELNGIRLVVHVSIRMVAVRRTSLLSNLVPKKNQILNADTLDGSCSTKFNQFPLMVWTCLNLELSVRRQLTSVGHPKMSLWIITSHTAGFDLMH